MVRVLSKRTVNIPYDNVWRLLCDLSTVKEYDTNVKSVEITSRYSKGIGATRCVYYVDGSSATEEVVQVGYGYVILKPKVDSCPSSNMTLTYTVKKVLDAWTEITLEANYSTRIGPAAVITLMFGSRANKKMQKRFEKILEGVDRHLSGKFKTVRVSR